MDLTSVGVRYGRRGPWVVTQVDLRIRPGDVVEVVGRNGAGKSSLLKVVAGVLPPAAGRVTGRPAVVGWAPERFPVRQAFTAREYLLHQGRIRGLSPVGSRAALDREADRLQLGPVLATRLAELSKGSAQKVGLAQAVLLRPELLVLDEPWSGLDAQACLALPGLVAEIVADGGSVLVSDHQQRAGDLPRTVRWRVDHGRVQARPVERTGEPADVLMELRVPAGQASGLLAELRGRGLAPRLRDRP